MAAVIEVNHLKKHFGNVKAVDDLNFEVEKGELFGFLGVNGAGKSTAINVLSTLFPPTDGTASICGYTLGKENEAIRQKIGVVYQHNCLDDYLTVAENLLIHASLYEKDSTKCKKRLDQVSEILSLYDIKKSRFGKLSGGQKRRCEIAKVLMNAPEILFLDEPTTGLDPATRQSVWNCISALQKEYKMTVFLTTHYMEEAAHADNIVIMDAGRLAEIGTPFSLKEQYANDTLRLYSDNTEILLQQLRAMNVQSKRKENMLTVRLSKTIDALAVLDSIRSMINGFEVIQGTMDDVFLNVTGKELKQ